jgi:hypothetical protein
MLTKTASLKVKNLLDELGDKKYDCFASYEYTGKEFSIFITNNKHINIPVLGGDTDDFTIKEIIKLVADMNLFITNTLKH